MIPFDTISLIVPTFFAGILMFLAPCTLPIVPGYLAFIAGIPESAAQARGARKRIVWNAFAFVVGFSIVFILLGTFAGLLGGFIAPWRDLLGRLAGVVLILFGFTMFGIVRIPALSSTSSIRIPHFIIIGRWESSLLLGMLFAFGWSPCIGPILGTVLTISLLASKALSLSAMLQGALLLGVFSAGLAVPFLITAFFLEKATAVLSHLTLLVKILSWVGGAGLITVGVLLVLGDMAFVTDWGLQFFNSSPSYQWLLNHM